MPHLNPGLCNKNWRDAVTICDIKGNARIVINRNS